MLGVGGVFGITWLAPATDGPQRAQCREIRTGAPIARERTNIHHFQRVIVGELGEFPAARIGNPLFLTENVCRERPARYPEAALLAPVTQRMSA